MKIFLIGFMGCGKSYLGKILAQKLGFLFIDLDSVIENTEGGTVPEIFEKQGETHFRKIESDCLRNLQKWDEVVVATGGGAACFNDNMTWMNNSGIVIYLKTNPHILLRRLLPEVAHRPLLRGKTEKQLLDFIITKVAEREKFYTRASIIIEQNDNGEDIVFDILEKILLLRQVSVERQN